MRISRFYYEGILRKDENLDLSLETSHYIKHVLRLKVGNQLILFNGDGKDFEATVVQLQKKIVTVKIGQYCDVHRESPLKIHLAQAISRAEKMDWAIQKSVELGVATITPLITSLCSVKLSDDRIAKRLCHWQKIVISACEQSGRSIITELKPPRLFADWVQTDACSLKLYCDPGSHCTLSSLPEHDEVMILIGPEGGLTNQEVVDAKQNDFIGISLGPRVLRTETAALAAVTVLQSRWGDM